MFNNDESLCQGSLKLVTQILKYVVLGAQLPLGIFYMTDRIMGLFNPGNKMFNFTFHLILMYPMA